MPQSYRRGSVEQGSGSKASVVLLVHRARAWLPARFARVASIHRFGIGRPNPRFAPAFACLILLAGCFSLRTTGAETIEDLQSEDAYKLVYAQQVVTVRGALQTLSPSGSNPGVCNKGGSKQGCYDADTGLIVAWQSMLEALRATSVPPRYVAGDGLLTEAIAKSIEGLDLRNRALEQNDNALWRQSASVLDEAEALFQRADQAFPADNHPVSLF